MTDKSSSALAQRVAGEEPKKDALHMMLEHHQKQFALNLTRPDGKPLIDPDRFVRLLLTTVRTTPKLELATSPSLLGAAMACAQLGLEPGGPLGQAYIVPFENRKATTVEATLIVGYQGYVDLMYRSDRVAGVGAHPVFEDEDFYHERGTNEHIAHRPKIDPEGPLIAAYGVVELVTGAKIFEIVSRRKIDEARARAKTDKIWKSDFEAMARKTALRRVQKWAPKSIELQAATVADGHSFRDVPEKLDDIEDVIDVEAFDDEEGTEDE